MKLIILNGPSGVGKSTLAARLHADVPLSVLIEVDVWRRFISAYREHKEESLALAYRFSLAAAEACLKAGNSVIIDKALFDIDTILDDLHALGKKYGADLHEFLLVAHKETLLKRADQRGWEPNSLLTREKIVELHGQAEKLKRTRPHAIVIETEALSAEAVYEHVKKICNL